MRKKYLIDEAPLYRRLLVRFGRLRDWAIAGFSISTHRSEGAAHTPLKEKAHDPFVQHEN